MKMVYNPSRDELKLQICPINRKPNKQIGPFKLWWDDDGHICAISIMSYTEEIKEFKKNRRWIKLGGIWKGIKIDEIDIKETRSELLKKLEERWEKW